MRRREFLAAAVAARSLPLPCFGQKSAPAPVSFGAPYKAALSHIDASNDRFACERRAKFVEHSLNRLLQSRSLPFAADFTGVSPVPLRYRRAAEGIGEAEYDASPNDTTEWTKDLHRWIDSLGPVRYSQFYALAGDRIRFEIAGRSEYRVGHWKLIWRDNQLVSFSPLDETLVENGKPPFEDATGHCLGAQTSFQNQLLKGNPWWRSHLDSATGIDIYGNNGIAVADINNDGEDEVYVCQPGGLPNRVYKVRRDGTFEDITTQTGLGILDDTTSALFADFRNAGAQDLILLRGAGPVYFQNDGRGKFTEQPNAFRFRTDPQGSFTGMAAADYDRDGKLDLYLCCYVYFQSEDQYRYPAPYHDAQNGPPNFLFRNQLQNEGGSFEDVTASAGLDHNNNRYSFAPAWCDYDGSGWPSLYVANDFGRNNLYRNRNGKFQDIAAEAGVEDIGPGMSASWFDYDGDGHPDLYVSNMWTAPGQRIVHDPAFRPSAEHPAAYAGHTNGNALYRNRGDGSFEATGEGQGVAMGRWAWSSGAFDFDNDGSPEIYVTAGMLTNGSKDDLGSFFWRQVVAESPMEAKYAPAYENGWNGINELIREDYSWCGRERNVFFKRPKGVARYYDFSGVSGLDFADDSRTFAVSDIDGDGNLDLLLKSRLGPQLRVLRNNSGVDKPAAAIRLRGTKSNRDAIGARVDAGGIVQYVTCGSGFLSQHSKTLHFAMLSGPTEVRITWPSGAVETYKGIEPGSCYDIAEGATEIKRTPFRKRTAWTMSEVTPVNSPEPADFWLLEPVPTPEPLGGPGFVVLYAGPRPTLPSGVPMKELELNANSASRFSVLRRYLLEYRQRLDLPVVLLLDDRSRVHKFYSSVPDGQTLQADWKRYGQPDRLAVALPFSGEYIRQPRRNYFKLGAAFYQAGFPDQALPYLEEELRRDPENWKAKHAVARIHLDGGRAREALKAYDEVMQLRPGYLPAVLGSGEAAMSLGDLAKAEGFFLPALNEKSTEGDAANQLGLLRVRQNRTSDAKQFFERAIRVQKDHSGAINNLGVLYMQSGQPGDAIAAFEFGIKQAPDDEQLYLNLGRVFVSGGQMERARETMQRLLARDPGNAAALRALSQLSSR